MYTHIYIYVHVYIHKLAAGQDITHAPEIQNMHQENELRNDTDFIPCEKEGLK